MEKQTAEKISDLYVRIEQLNKNIEDLSSDNISYNHGMTVYIDSMLHDKIIQVFRDEKKRLEANLASL